MIPTYRKALDRAGYHDTEATEKNVRECFSDYVDTGFFADLTLEEVDEISTEEICRALLRI